METNPRIVDTHAHLPMLTHASADEILLQAQTAGLFRIITVSTEPDNWESSRQFAEKFDHIYYTLGLHPHEAKIWEENKPRLQKYFSQNKVPAKCVGIGETGLDFHYNLSSREEQIKSFEDQIDLSIDLKLPLIIHCRDAFVDTYAALRRRSQSRGQTGQGVVRGVMHCFTGDLKQAQEALDLGLMISFSGILTFKNAAVLQQVAQSVPEKSILVETDCPFLTPVPLRGKPNEPALIVHTLRRLAELRGVSFESMAEISTRNALEFFQLPE